MTEETSALRIDYIRQKRSQNTCCNETVSVFWAIIEKSQKVKKKVNLGQTKKPVEIIFLYLCHRILRDRKDHVFLHYIQGDILQFQTFWPCTVHVRRPELTGLTRTFDSLLLVSVAKCDGLRSVTCNIHGNRANRAIKHWWIEPALSPLRLNTKWYTMLQYVLYFMTDLSSVVNP